MSLAGKALERFQRIRQEQADAQRRMNAVGLVRTGHANEVFGNIFPESWPKPVIANMIDIAATDTAEMVGVMPTLTAFGDESLNESQRSRAAKLTKIVNAYTYEMRLGTSLVTAGDYLASYGQTILRIEPDYERNLPFVHVDSPLGAHVERDRFNRVVGYYKTHYRTATELANLYPEHADRLLGKGMWTSSEANRRLTLVKVIDSDGVCMLLVEQEPDLVLDVYQHPLGRVPIVVAQRPTIDGEARGQFDDALWVFAARSRMALLNIEAAQKSVEAPLALPNDVQEVAFGPDSILRSQTPERIRRIPMEVPQSAFMEMRTLQDELRLSSRMPDVRMGETDSSVVTGRGVQALLGGFDTRIRTYQSLMGSAIADSMSMALELDEKLWPNDSKEITGSVNGSPFTIKYTPAKDIKGSYQVSAEYGVMAGLDPNRALIWGLQALGAGLTSKSFIRKNLPVSLDIAHEEQVIDVENLRDSLLSSVSAYAQAIPSMAASGQDAAGPVRAIADLIEARKKGIPVEKAASEIFAPPPPPPEAASQGQEPTPDAPGQPAAPGGGIPSGPPPPQGMQQLLSQLTGNGNATASVRTMQQSQI